MRPRPTTVCVRGPLNESCILVMGFWSSSWLADAPGVLHDAQYLESAPPSSCRSTHITGTGFSCAAASQPTGMSTLGSVRLIFEHQLKHIHKEHALLTYAACSSPCCQHIPSCTVHSPFCTVHALQADSQNARLTKAVKHICQAILVEASSDMDGRECGDGGGNRLREENCSCVEEYRSP